MSREPESSSSQTPSAPRWKRVLSRLLRPLLFLLGAIALVVLVMNIGPAAVWDALSGAGVWLPLIFLLDLSWLAAEGLAVRVLYGEKSRSIPLSAWIEATLIHFSTFMVVPVGRASAEVARAGLLGKHVGKSRAAAAAAVMQSFTLIANAMLSVLCLIAVWILGRSQTLLGAVALNIAITLTLGVLTYLLLRHVKVGGAVGRFFPKLNQIGQELDVQIREASPRHGGALLVCFLGRSLQVVQYGVIFFAVVGTVSGLDALTAQGIQLVSRTLGDAVPNQVGVTETAFAAAAPALGLAAHPEKAVAIALLARLSNLSMAGLCALLVQFVPRSEKSSEPVAS